jgi:RNA polymerase sigma factor (sigma-70 family)
MDIQWLAAQFQHTRAHLREVAFRMLGSAGDADDAVQETWLRLSRADTSDVTNLGGWLTTVTARVCLDMLRARKIRQTAPADDVQPPRESGDPARDVMLADSIGAAMLVVLDTLAPAERVAFVLHDIFDLPFDEVARIIDRSEAATRQLASRARRRVQRRDAAPDGGRASGALVDAFFAAARGRDLAGLLAVLDPDVVLRVDEHALQTAASTKWAQQDPPLEREVRGANGVARMLNGRAGGATRATIDGAPGAAWVPRGEIRSAFVFTFDGDGDGARIAAIDIIMEPDALAELDIQLDDVT